MQKSLLLTYNFLQKNTTDLRKDLASLLLVTRVELPATNNRIDLHNLYRKIE